MPKLQTGRLEYLDALRGIAALSVVIFHYTLDMSDQQALGPIGRGFVSVFDDTLDLGKFGVVLFFLISGYIIPNSLGVKTNKIERFGISRFFRLYPLYWGAVFVGTFVYGEKPTQGLFSHQFLANLTMIQGYLGQGDIVGSAWTLQIELTFYGVCILLAARHRLSSPRACAMASIFFLILAFLMALARGLLIRKLPVALPLGLCLMFFGTTWRQATLSKLWEAKRLVRYLAPCIAVGMFPISILAYNHDFGFHEKWQPYAICYLLAMITFMICTTRVLVNIRALVWIGQISYSLYLIHPLIASGAYQFGMTPHATGISGLAFATGLASIAILASWATYTLIEKPFVRIGHTLIRTVVERRNATTSETA